MLSPEDNELLTRTGAGTRMGDYFRRYWLPVALSQELPERDGAPIRVKALGEEFHIATHEVGFAAGAARKADGNDFYWRIAQYMLPNHALTPNALPGENIHGQTWVPIDDVSCWVYCYTWNPDRPLTDEERQQYRGGRTVHAMLDERWVPIRNRDNDYLIDRNVSARRTRRSSSSAGRCCAARGRYVRV